MAIWKQHLGNDKTMFLFQECSVFLFEKRCAEKLHKPKRKETVTELLRASVKQLERFRHPKVKKMNKKNKNMLKLEAQCQ